MRILWTVVLPCRDSHPSPRLGRRRASGNCGRRTATSKRRPLTPSPRLRGRGKTYHRELSHVCPSGQIVCAHWPTRRSAFFCIRCPSASACYGTKSPSRNLALDPISRQTFRCPGQPTIQARNKIDLLRLTVNNTVSQSHGRPSRAIVGPRWL